MFDLLPFYDTINPPFWQGGIYFSQILSHLQSVHDVYAYAVTAQDPLRRCMFPILQAPPNLRLEDPPGISPVNISRSDPGFPS